MPHGGTLTLGTRILLITEDSPVPHPAPASWELHTPVRPRLGYGHGPGHPVAYL